LPAFSQDYQQSDISLMRRQVAPLYALLFLIIIYVVGIAGLWSPYELIFRQLTPLNLLLTGAVLLYYHRGWNTQFIVFAVFVVIAGYAVEWVGVHTGLVFGTYSYGTTLGLRLDGVPLIIGLNWLILVYGIGHLLFFVQWNRLMKALSGAALMVVTDVFLEVVAIHFGFWNWEGGAVPIDNYLGWFAVSLVFFLLFFYMDFKKENKVAIGIFAIQLTFFILNTLIIKF
jgi:putative membrane protein